MNAEFMCANVPYAILTDERETELKHIVSISVDEDFAMLVDLGIIRDDCLLKR